MRLLRGLVRETRPQQWVKNLLVFAAPVAAGRLAERDVFLHTVAAFVLFCMLAGGTYLLNDIRDVDADRAHPTKRNRPIAAGDVPIPVALVTAVVLVVAAVAGAFAVTVALGITVAAYLALTVTYTIWWKHIAIYDIVAVAALFVLRAIAGAAATGVPISEWFFIVTSFGALFMVVGKREGEQQALADDASKVRATLGEYSPSYLRYVRAVSSALVLIGYCLWAFESASRPGVDGAAGFWYQLSILPFTIAILRYALLLDRGQGGEPEKLVMSDRSLLLAAAAWAAIYGYGTYIA